MEGILILGDCYDELEKIESESIDLILTDPPYQISRESNFTKNSTNKKFNTISLDFGIWDHDDLNLNLLFKQFYRILRKGGQCIIFYDIWKSESLLKSAKSVGFKQPRVCQWVKSNPVPINSKKNYLSNSIEFFFTFVKKSNPVFNSEYDKGIYNYPICHGKERTNHPTQKPLRLIEKLIEKHSLEGQVVLDCFAGSGTTGIASKKLKRKYILIEKDKDYHALCVNRLWTGK
jgi:site-specific DNA-methyltransferase (adenine-specific)